MTKPNFKLYRLVRRVLGAHLTAAIFGYYLYEGPSNLSLAKLAAMWDSIDV